MRRSAIRSNGRAFLPIIAEFKVAQVSAWNRDAARIQYNIAMRKPLWLALILVSIWADDQIPRPEYPQPQFERATWLNLNGTWEFEFDDKNSGLEEQWASSNRKFSKSITVPFCFESPRSGIADTSFHPWAWYRRAVTLPENWSGKRLLLNF